jgi:hypothetical protein
MQTQNNRKSRQQKSAPKKQNKHPNMQEGTLTIPRSVGCYMPDRLRTTLRFWKSVPVSLASLSYASIRFNPSGAYDLDPTVGSATAAGYTQLAAIYNSYRVKRSRAVAEVVNTGNVTVMTVLLPSNTDPGASPSGNYVISTREQPYAVADTGALSGGPISKVKSSMSTQKIYGSKMTDYDDNFAALVNAIPNNNWYWVITFYAQAVSPSAIILNFYMEIDIEFYDRATTLKS